MHMYISFIYGFCKPNIYDRERKRIRWKERVIVEDCVILLSFFLVEKKWMGRDCENRVVAKRIGG